MMANFKKHKREWFVNRVGQLIRREITQKTRVSAISPSLPEVLTICSEQHAASLYIFHLDNKINFNEVKAEDNAKRN